MKSPSQIDQYKNIQNSQIHQYTIFEMKNSHSSTQQIFNPRTSKSLTFIPFVLQRDGVGKLIKNKQGVKHQYKNIIGAVPKKFNNQQIKESRLTQSIPYGEVDSPEQTIDNKYLAPKLDIQSQKEKQQKFTNNNKTENVPFFRHKSTLSLIDSSINQKMDNQRSLKNFKLKNLSCSRIADFKTRKQFQIEQMNRNGLPRSQKQLIYFKDYRDSYDGFLRNQDRTKFRKPISIYFKNQSQLNLPKLSNPSLAQSPMKRFASIDQIYQNSKKNRYVTNNMIPNSQQHKDKVPSLNSQKIKVKVTRQHPQLKRFQQMQKLSIKVVTDFDQSHVRFIQKMKNTKVNAIKIKQQLELD